MPHISYEDLKDHLEKHDSFFFSIDTNLFERKQYRFDIEPISTITLLSDRFKLLIPQIIYNEIQARHLEFLQKNISGATKALNSLPSDEKIREGLKKLRAMNASDLSASILKIFFKSSNVTILKNTVDLDQMLDDYFKKIPPFSERKKSEFPDAIALRTLETYGINHNAKIIIFSQDPDWKNFCLDSCALHLFNDDGDIIQKGLFLFKSKKLKNDTLTYVKNHITTKKITSVKNCIQSKIEDFFDDLSSVECEASSSHTFELDQTANKVNKIHFTESDWSIEDEDEDTLTINGLIQVNIDCMCDAFFSIWDSVDREYIDIGATPFSANADVSIEINVFLSKNDTNTIDDDSFDSCEVVTKQVDIDLGYISPFEHHNN